MRKLVSLISLLFTFTAFSQTLPDKVKVFVDCSQTNICNLDFIRSEINMVDFVRDRQSADVHVLVTSQYSNTGGTKGTLNFIGLRSFKGASDTLTFFNDPTSTEDQQRKKIVQNIKLGLVRYIAKSKMSDDVVISYTAKTTDKKDTIIAIDHWHNWVYQLSTFGSFSGSETYKNASLNTSISANKETEKLKMSGLFASNKSVDTYVDSSGKSRFTRKGLDGNFDVVKVINKHWAFGFEGAYANSLFSNIHASYKFRPKIEYSLYPYSKFNTERVVFEYLLGVADYHYYDTTVYFKIKESRVQQTANVIASFTKPWGAINLGIFYSNYMNDFSSNNLNFNGAVVWKVTKGLNFALWGNYGVVHDQIALRKGSTSRDDLLVKTRELKSNYNYNLGIAFTYRFGSILNNLINPAFRGLNYSINF